jgi:hypothetical protein
MGVVLAQSGGSGLSPSLWRASGWLPGASRISVVHGGGGSVGNCSHDAPNDSVSGSLWRSVVARATILLQTGRVTDRLGAVWLLHGHLASGRRRKMAKVQVALATTLLESVGWPGRFAAMWLLRSPANPGNAQKRRAPPAHWRASGPSPRQRPSAPAQRSRHRCGWAGPPAGERVPRRVGGSPGGWAGSPRRVSGSQDLCSRAQIDCASGP